LDVGLIADFCCLTSKSKNQHSSIFIQNPNRHIYGFMTMVKKSRQIAAGEFKAKCLALLDEVSETGQPILVTKRGKPVAQVVPVEGNEPPSLKGSIVFEGDIISPIDTDWEANWPRRND
jgi:prevent-host-death family protein